MSGPRKPAEATIYRGDEIPAPPPSVPVPSLDQLSLLRIEQGKRWQAAFAVGALDAMDDAAAQARLLTVEIQRLVGAA